jgi:hypothetical protein
MVLYFLTNVYQSNNENSTHVTCLCLQDSSNARKREIVSSFITEILLALKEVIETSIVFAQLCNF